MIATTTLRFACRNDECPDAGSEWEAEAVETHGTVEPRYPQDEYCVTCGAPGEDAA